MPPVTVHPRALPFAGVRRLPRATGAQAAGLASARPAVLPRPDVHPVR